jgi:monovalent cation/proton antiporter MnhG/PhaG subunit
MTALLALLAKIVGTMFLVVATLGVLRFKDPFQRMHAATKAGTLGAGLVLLGAALAKGSFDATLVALLTIVFLIATMPVAGHLLGRAAYISGAPLRSRSDALAGVLPRMTAPLEDRLDPAQQARMARSEISAFAASELVRDASKRTLPSPEPTASKAGPAAAADQAPETLQEPPPAPVLEPPAPVFEPEVVAATHPWSAPGYAAVRFPVIGPEAGPLASRAWRLAVAREVPAIGIAVLDTTCLETARIPQASDRMRACLATAVTDTRRVTGTGRVPFTLIYEDGDPLALIPGTDDTARELLLLPTDGWCHHGAQFTFPVYEDRMADKLFTLAERHAGPTLFAGTGEPEEQRCVIVHDGTERTQRLALWALRTGIWSLREITLIGRPQAGQVADLAVTAADLGLAFDHLTKTNALFSALLPRLHAGVSAVIMGEPPQPARVNAYGTFWQDRLIPGFRGDVLIA